MAQTTVVTANTASKMPMREAEASGRSRSDEAKSGHESLYLNDIWRRARQRWEAAGKPPGDSSRFWLEAEQELLQGS